MRCGFILTLLTIGLLPTVAWTDDWPQWLGPQRDGVWRESGIVKTLPKQLKVLWRAPLGAGYSGPSVVGDRIYVMDKVPAPEGSPKGIEHERIVCLDANTGESVWRHVFPTRYEVGYASGPRMTPTVHAGKLYAAGAMGQFFCLQADDGKILWTKHYGKEYGWEINSWGVASAPLVDGQKLLCLVGGKDNACVVAFDKDTGKELWRSLQAADPGYAPPIVYNEGGRRQLMIFTPFFLASLDPETGKKYWEQEYKANASLTIAQPILEPDRRLLFVSSFYNGGMMMRLDANEPKASVLWRGQSDSEIKTDGLHSLMCTAVIRGDHIYGIGSYGQLRCIELETGKRVWETFAATGHGRWWNAFIIPHEDRYFIHNEQGELIIAHLSPDGYKEDSRVQLIAPTGKVQGRDMVWSHPAFAHQRVFARNDKEMVCVDLAAQ